MAIEEKATHKVSGEFLDEVIQVCQQTSTEIDRLRATNKALLEAMKEIKACGWGSPAASDNHPVWKRLDAAIKQARAAIELAEGKEL